MKKRLVSVTDSIKIFCVELEDKDIITSDKDNKKMADEAKIESALETGE